jgi:hypothetical protein
VLKNRVHRGLPAGGLYHVRHVRGLEIDLLIEDGTALTAIEVKSATTLTGDQTGNLRRFGEQVKSDARSALLALVYGGAADQARSGVDVIGWASVDNQTW